MLPANIGFPAQRVRNPLSESPGIPYTRRTPDSFSLATITSATVVTIYPLLRAEWSQLAAHAHYQGSRRWPSHRARTSSERVAGGPTGSYPSGWLTRTGSAREDEKEFVRSGVLNYAMAAVSPRSAAPAVKAAKEHRGRRHHGTMPCRPEKIPVGPSGPTVANWTMASVPSSSV